MRFRVIALVTLAACLSSLAVGVLYYQRTTTLALTRAQNDLGQRAKLLVPLVEQAYRELGDDAQVIASTPPIQGLIRSLRAGGYDELGVSSTETWRERLEKILESFLLRLPHYRQLLYVV
ncbi:MAG: hypothetical protein ACF8XB_17455, partial [Planctomycetota bacterium JB042]